MIRESKLITVIAWVFCDGNWLKVRVWGIFKSERKIQNLDLESILRGMMVKVQIKVILMPKVEIFINFAKLFLDWHYLIVI